MLELVIPEREYFDSERSKILRKPEVVVWLEHSLLSMSKWESKWTIPFLGREKKTPEQLLDYVRFMSSTEIDDETLNRLGAVEMQAIGDYVNAPHSATTFLDSPSTSSNKIVTTELIYYWMVAYQIPFTCETWPLPRLMNLIRIAQIKAEEADPKKKRRNTASRLTDRAALNKKRREEMNSKG